MAEVEGYGPIDIPSPEFFWLVQPWREGRLATLDGWGRFAEISFIGANKLQVKPFGNFPRVQLDRNLLTWPEAGLIASSSGKMHHLAAVDDNKVKSHVPLLSWVYTEIDPVLLDPEGGLVGYGYYISGSGSIDTKLFVYNYKEDRMASESPEDFTITLCIAMDDRHILSHLGTRKWNQNEFKKIFYDWRADEVVENDLTKALNENNIDLIIRYNRNIHLGGRNLFGYSRTIKKVFKVTWNGEYSNVKVTPLDYLMPEGKGLDDFILSGDGKWASTLVWGYRGLYDEKLNKRAFFHLDGRYPNGISIPVITEDYEERIANNYSAFVEHPVHGLCFAQEWHKNEDGKDKLYLRLYKMDGVLDEINRQLLEKAIEIVRQ